MVIGLTKSKNIGDLAIDRFAAVARHYCEWAESNLEHSHDGMEHVRLLLAELHLAAVNLPDLGIGKNIDAVTISHDEWSQFYKKFAGLPVTYYFDVFNPLEEESPVTNSLADDLADIYGDVKAGLDLYDAQHPIEAAWEWRFNFQVHWGQHLVGAQRAIHEYLSNEGL